MLGIVSMLVALLGLGWGAWVWLRPADCASCGNEKAVGRSGICSNCGKVYRRDAF
jgi:hypothetical protein